MVNLDGTVHKKFLVNTVNSPYYMPGQAVISGYDVTVTPDELKFQPSKNEKVDISAGYVNYELIYSGTDGMSIKITYREYTPDDLARPAFFQNLVYSMNQKTIRFKNTVIKVHQATNEMITYTVMSDNLTKHP